jgi:trk system potassium uptake protein TrkH
VLHLAISLAGLMALLLTQPHSPAALAFETVSATGTVGLSLSVTPTLTTSGRLLVVLLMFAGRVGPMSLALLLGRAREIRTDYPESRLMVG